MRPQHTKPCLTCPFWISRGNILQKIQEQPDARQWRPSHPCHVGTDGLILSHNMTRADAHSQINLAVRKLETEAYCRGIKRGIVELKSIIQVLRSPGGRTSESIEALVASACSRLTMVVVNSGSDGK